MNKNIVISIIISVSIIAFTFYTLSKTSINENSAVPVENVFVKDGVQYITINVRGGYTPKTSIIKSDIPTKLIMRTNDTYDCSVALSIPSFGVRKMLQSTGEEIIDLGSIESGKTINGTCSMGMYRFKIVAE